MLDILSNKDGEGNPHQFSSNLQNNITKWCLHPLTCKASDPHPFSLPIKYA